MEVRRAQHVGMLSDTAVQPKAMKNEHVLTALTSRQPIKQHDESFPEQLYAQPGKKTKKKRSKTNDDYGVMDDVDAGCVR